MTNKAFIFDLDGVMIDSETWWGGQSLGQTINSHYQQLKKTQPKLLWDKYFLKLNQKAKIIYNQAPLTPNINDLIQKLIKDNYRLALVSGSTQQWINYVVMRLKFPIKLTLSLQDRQDLQPKPAPDGYLEAMKKLGVKPKNAIILEDSQMGLDSAKATGAYVVCLTQHHPKNYHPLGADLYVKSLAELLNQLPVKILPRAD